MPRPLVADTLVGDSGQRAMRSLAELYLKLRRYPEAAVVVREAWVSHYADDPRGVDLKGTNYKQDLRKKAEESLLKRHPQLLMTIGDVRNDIEHGGFRKNPKPASALKGSVGKLVASLDTLPTTWFVSRHPGAKEWAAENGLKVDKQVDHLNISFIKKGDVVLGTLPVSLAAEVCARGGQYFHLTLEVPPEVRGQELTVGDMRKYGARLEPFRVEALDKETSG